MIDRRGKLARFDQCPHCDAPIDAVTGDNAHALAEYPVMIFGICAACGELIGTCRVNDALLICQVGREDTENIPQEDKVTLRAEQERVWRSKGWYG